MRKIFEIVKSNPLFYGIAFSDFEAMLNCLTAKMVNYKKGDIILMSGDNVDFVGILIQGDVKIVREDFNGNITILTKISAPETFGEVFACAEIFHSPVTAQATTDSEIMLIDYKRIITSCTNACIFHAMLVKNMLKLIAKKNLALNGKNEILSKRTTKEKLLCFFDQQRGIANNFTIPFSREEMANYLCVDRSAMSNELSKMRDEGLIKFDKNKFELLTR
ncbi:MAG: Crp/Fnr family transcriptional regulator [Defluviitaleaceae bacterium]|nr:Crp/Fnr family transcriptional regulator [Defluviitaleaceae bacterium]